MIEEETFKMCTSHHPNHSCPQTGHKADTRPGLVAEMDVSAKILAGLSYCEYWIFRLLKKVSKPGIVLITVFECKVFSNHGSNYPLFLFAKGRVKRSWLSKANFKNIPIIALTVYAMSGDRKQ